METTPERFSAGMRHDELCNQHGRDIQELKEDTKDYPVVIERLETLTKTVNGMRQDLDNKFVTREKFDDTVVLLQRIVFGFIGLIIVGVVSAWVTNVIRTGQ
jgi:tetrahydromethanopterin S-methyltransferase subunit B